MTAFATFRVQVGPPVRLGQTGFGEARIVPILGGIVEGPGLTGRILPGGSDEQAIRGDGLTRIHARYVIETPAGALVRVDSQGLRAGPPAVMERLLRGERVDPAQVYFMTTIRFETADSALDSLNQRLFLARGQREPDGVLLHVTRLD